MSDLKSSDRVRAAAAPQPQPEEDQGARVEPLTAGVVGQDLPQSGNGVVVTAAERTEKDVDDAPYRRSRPHGEQRRTERRTCANGVHYAMHGDPSCPCGEARFTWTVAGGTISLESKVTAEYPNKAGKAATEPSRYQHPSTPIHGAVPASPWQPIATAPKDGTQIVLIRNDDIGYRRRVEFGWFAQTGCNGATFTGWFPFSAPTHWMPLPPLPDPPAPHRSEKDKHEDHVSRVDGE